MKKKTIAIATLSAMLLCQPISLFADAAPDGKTDAATTPAAQNGAWEAWKTKWETIKNDWTQVSMAPGADETEMNFSWYSKEGETTSFKYGLKEDLSDGQVLTVIQSDGQTGYKTNKVTITGLQAGTKYYYQVASKVVASFTTDDDTSDFSFIFVGDPQIGSSNEEKAKKPADILKDTFKTAQSESVRSDTFNWNNTLNQAYSMSGNNASFILSAGDQIQTNAKKVADTTVSEIEYTGYLSADLLKNLPVATTVGNHDADNANYTYHFNQPNMSDLGTNGVVGGDYYYTYGGALFMMLNTQDTNVSEHQTFIEQAVAANPDCTWRVVTLHQDIYGSAEHSNEPEITNLRYQLVPIFEANDVDVVLTGHDHAYSRSKMLQGGTKTTDYTDDEFDAQLEKDLDNGDSKETLYTAPGNIQDDTTDASEQTYLSYLKEVMDANAVETATEGKDVAINSNGVLYMTAGSSSGSKYYDLVPREQAYIANRWQEDVPTYTIANVTETTFTLNTYRSDNNEKIDSQFTLVKSVDHSDLETLINEANKINQTEYTDETVNVFVQALQGAIKVNDNASATAVEITNAYTALKEAMDGLVKKTTGTITGTKVDGQNAKPTVQSSVKTGDSTNYLLSFAAASISLIVARTVLIKKRKNEA